MRRKLKRWLAPLRSTWSWLRWNLTSLFYQIWRFLEWATRRVRRAFNRRKSRFLIQGLPALLALVAVLVVAGMIFADHRDQRIQRYQQAAAKNFQNNDIPAAQICYERLSQLDTRPEFRFWLALTAQQLAANDQAEAIKLNQAGQKEAAEALLQRANGQFQRTASIMKQLANPREQGYAPAHVWWARRLLGTRNPALVNEAEIHLRRALQEQPDNVEANALIGQVYLSLNNLEKAEAHLLKIVAYRPELNLDLGRLYAVRGNRDLARIHGEQARKHFKKLSDANVDNHPARAALHEACLFLGDFSAAVRVLEEGLKLSGNLSYRPAIARAFVLWSDAVARFEPEKDSKDPKDPKNPANIPKDLKIDASTKLTARVALLERALQYDFGNLVALSRLLELTRSKQPDEAEKARTTLRGLLAAGKHPATIHLVLGMDAQNQGKVPKAREHFEQAYKLSPEMPILINNLAWSMAFAEKPELQEALELIEGALKRQPQNPRFRETRGQVLVKMGKYQEALPDLEAGLRVLKGNPNLHKALAETYRSLGNTAMAAEHQRLAGANESTEDTKTK